MSEPGKFKPFTIGKKDPSKSEPKLSSYHQRRVDEEKARSREAQATEKTLKEFKGFFGADDDDDEKKAPPSRPSNRHGSSSTSMPGAPRHISGYGLGRFTNSRDDVRRMMPPTKRPRGNGIVQPAWHELELGLQDTDVEDTDLLSVPPRQTAYMNWLPPEVREKHIRGWLPEDVIVDEVRIEKPKGQLRHDREAMSALLVFSEKTPFTAIQECIRELNNSYSTRGYTMHVKEYMTTAIIDSTTSDTAARMAEYAGSHSLPFNAKQAEIAAPPSYNRVAPPDQRMFAPGQMNVPPPTVVKVEIPLDIMELRTINKTIAMVKQFGLSVEYEMMRNEEIQADETMAWLFDSRSVAGVYYRWRLIQAIREKEDSNDIRRPSRAIREPLFDKGVLWDGPKNRLTFGHCVEPADIALCADYKWLDDANYSNENEKQVHKKPYYLNPYNVIKFESMLGRLPTSTAQLTYFDVVNITSLVLEQSAFGLDLITDRLAENVISPFSLKPAHPANGSSDIGSGGQTDDGEATRVSENKVDQIGPRIVAMTIITDALRQSGVAYVSTAWRLGTVLGEKLISSEAFAQIGRLHREEHFGKIKTDRWQRTVHSMLKKWGTLNLFPAKVLKVFKDHFDHPRLTDEEEEAERKEAERRKARAEELAAIRRESLKHGSKPEGGADPTSRIPKGLQQFARAASADPVGKPIELKYVDLGDFGSDSKMDVDETDGELLAGVVQWDESTENMLWKIDKASAEKDEDAEDEMVSDDENTLPAKAVVVTDKGGKKGGKAGVASKNQKGGKNKGESAAARAKRERPKAIDMFASDSDEDMG
ncbi:MAG: hypothetical protein M1820_006999 [Bogoriella megaspora]|nr:MAG: hypothetical protein M1820_006999 [Bogoriella megaspora]